jgi:prepilin-type N-terminal cleavage/methylation domain-containing protein
VRRSNTHGFTLIELLISLVLVGVIMGAILSLNLGTGRATGALQSRNTLLSDTQAAQNYLVSRLQTAVYVFPVNAVISLGVSGATITNPANASANWKVGTHPLIAFIVPPRNPSPTPGSCPVSTSTTTAAFLNCYYFFAYYAIPRTQLTGTLSGGTYSGGVTGPGNPGYNTTTANASVLMEYRARYSPDLLGFSGYSPSLVNIPPGGTGVIVLDYLRLDPTPTGATAPVLFSQVDSAQPGVASVTVQLATRQGNVSVPPDPTNTNQRYSVQVYPRNIGAAMIAN